ncbi:MAG: methyl-accepting chemotaxis protein, partial [Deferribacteraceae bacterium]|nr:methyl-accepting chemotaxis protein [Deferribacteraceae bacterium]
MKRQISFRMKLLLPIVLTAILAFSVISVVIYKITYNEIDSLAKESIWNLTYRQGNITKNTLEKAITTIGLINDGAVGFTNNPAVTRQRVLDYLQKTMDGASPEVLGTYIVWDAGAFDGAEDQFAPYVSRNGGGFEQSTITDLEQPWYTATKQSNKLNISDIWDVNEGVGIISVSMPMAIDGKNVGVVGVHIDTSVIDKVFKSEKIYTSGYMFLVAPSGIMTVHLSKPNVGNPTPVYKDLKPYMDKREPYFVEKLATATGILSYTFYAPIQIGETDYVYYPGLSVPKHEIFAAMNKIKLLMPIIAIISIIVFTVVVILLSRMLMKLLGGEPEQISEQVHMVAQGDLTVDIPLRGEDTTSLAYAVNNMVYTLNTMVSHTRDISVTLQGSSDALLASGDKLSSSTAEQTACAGQITTASTEMFSATEAISKSLTEIASFSQQTIEQVVSGRSSVDSSMQEIEKIK